MKAIAAMSRNRVIGKDGAMPWHFSPDLKFFKRTTLGQVVVMGRRTFESLGRPLPGRENIVLSTSSSVGNSGVRVVSSLAEIPREVGEGREVFVIGGAQLYAALLPECSSLFLTHLDFDVEGDTFFPEFETQFSSYQIAEKGEGYEVREYRRNLEPVSWPS